jgi:peptidoglycan/LPS O-acetylase OafA/YrhL
VSVAAARDVKSLDLLRSYAVFSVVMAHTVNWFGAPAALAPLQLGGTGVDLFFVLSGWLLGKQLLIELRETRRIELTRFWTRRWLRTLPAYLAVLGVTFIQAQMNGVQTVDWRYLVFAQNYNAHIEAFYVSWSLCVEEHFYLLVGPMLLLLTRLGNLRWLLLFVVLAVPLVSRLTGAYGSLHETHVRWDECAVGVILAAICVFRPGWWMRLCRLAPYLAALGLAAYIANFWFRYHPEVGVGDYDAVAYAWIFGSWLLLAVSSPWWQRVLYVPGAGYLAKRAYAVYLLHPDALGWLSERGITSFPLFMLATWVITLAAAEVLYRAVELPFMNMRERFAISRSRASTPAPFETVTV